MNDQEFIRQLIDFIKSIDAKKAPSNDEDKEIHITVGSKLDPRDIESPLDDDDVFIPPLQQRIEMLKKLSGIEQDNKDSMSFITGDDPTDN